MNIICLKEEFSSIEEHIFALNKTFFFYSKKGKFSDRGTINSDKLIMCQQSLIRVI